MEKFHHIHLFISIIFSTLLVVLGNEISLSSLNSSYIMEAKERFMSFDITKLANPPMPSYTFSIYNRGLFEKSEFMNYDSLLEHRLARSEARAKHLGSILENGTHEVLTRTSIRFINGEYIAAFILGTEQNIATRYLLVDTGSDFVWWQCGPCQPNKCYEQRNEPLYYFSHSRTYRKIDCRAQPRKCILKPNVFECIAHENTCIYDYRYQDGSRTRGWVAEDVISFALDHSQVRILFGCGKDQTSGTHFSGHYSGIVGLGRRNRAGGYSLPSQFGADIMALCLPDFYSTQSTTLTFHTTPFRQGTKARLIPNPALPIYFVDLYKLFVNSREIPLSPHIGSVVDTGSAVTSLPRHMYTAFRDAFRSQVHDYHLSDAPHPSFDTCYKVNAGVSPRFPVVRMYFGHYDSEHELVLQQHRLVVHERGLYCLAFLPWDHNMVLIGSYQLQGVGLTFNTAENTLSFALDAC